MDIALSVTLGLLFLISGFASLMLLYRMCGYTKGLTEGKPVDLDLAPESLRRLHMIFLIVFTALYAVMMIEMVPRLWNYQVELPPRSAMHVCLGFLIGVLLTVELLILRVFKHLQLFVPQIATLVMGCTVLLLGLSVPGALREYGLARGQVGGGVYSVENRARVSRLLPLAEMPPDAPLAELSTVESLRHGRELLATKCVECHDLKTILAQPRPPAGWWRTVERMAEKPTFDEPMETREMYDVTAYLIAITGDLQRSARQQREQKLKQQQAIAVADGDAAAPPPPYDAAAAEKAYTTVCSQCHELGEVDKKPPTTAKEVKEVIERMVADNGLSAPPADLDLTYAFMVRKFAPGEVATAPATLGAAVGADVKAAMGGGNAPDVARPSEPAPTEAPAEPAPSDSSDKPAPTEPARPADPAKKPKPAPAKPAVDGKPLYMKLCAACHDASGAGKPGLKSKNIPDMTAKDWQKKHSKASVIKALKVGVPGTVMKSFEAKLKPEELDAVAAFVKKLK
jgi:mono/diheme cytochrome c family protein